MDKEQARKLYELADRLSKLDVNTLSEEQLAERSAMIARLQEVKQRLDPKCWKGYKKQGTKIKGGVRVNNCVPESVEQELDEKWSQKYKDSIDCNHPKGFSQKAHCAGKNESIEEANGEYNDEAGMAQSNLRTMARAVNGLLDTIEDNDNLPEWAQEKIAKAEMMVTSVWDYLLSQKEQGIDPKVENTINEFAPDDGSGGEEETLHKYARMWYNGDLHTQQQVEKILDRLGWEIGEIESEEGGAFVVRSGDENGNSYIGFAVADLTESVTETKKPSPKLTPVNIKKTDPVSEEINKEAYERLQKVFAFKNYES